MRPRRILVHRLAPHFLASILALLYAWQISKTVYFQTGLQFVAPVVVIITFHLIWLAFTSGFQHGFSFLIYRRSAQSAGAMAIFILLSSFVVPMPANAVLGNAFGEIFGILICVAMITAVVGIIIWAIHLFSKAIRSIAQFLRGKDKSSNDSRLFDLSSLCTAVVFLCVASLEGIPSAYKFISGNSSHASYFINASPEHVWKKMELATSPDFPLPEILSIFPRPVHVEIDEGSTLGAMRKVKFQGREGKGYLTLQVVEKTETKAVFEALSDTSPIANWVAHRKLIYQLQSQGQGTKLTVTLEYDRLLAPSWFFDPVIKGAAYLAMDVLARDVKHRAES